MLLPGMPYIFINELGHKFEICQPVVELMTQFVQNHPRRPEAGGVLLGRFIIDSDDVVVDKITVPTKADKQSLFRFFRSAKHHQLQITREWSASGGRCNYLGEWHTHPEPNPSPSDCDLADWRKRLQFDTFDSNFIFFVIIGTYQLKVWQGVRKTLAIELLSPIS